MRRQVVREKWSSRKIPSIRQQVVWRSYSAGTSSHDKETDCLRNFIFYFYFHLVTKKTFMKGKKLSFEQFLASGPSPDCFTTLYSVIRMIVNETQCSSETTTTKRSKLRIVWHRKQILWQRFSISLNSTSLTRLSWDKSQKNVDWKSKSQSIKWIQELNQAKEK